jgi:hypothetical protein
MNQDTYAQLELVDGGIRGEDRKVMDLQELVNTGRKARKETEDFINRYLHDRAKEWPVICRLRMGEEAVAEFQRVKKQTGRAP